MLSSPTSRHSTNAPYPNSIASDLTDCQSDWRTTDDLAFGWAQSNDVCCSFTVISFIFFILFNIISSVFLSTSSRFSLYEISLLTFDIILTVCVTSWLHWPILLSDISLFSVFQVTDMSYECPCHVRYRNALMVKIFVQLDVTVRDPLTTFNLGLNTVLSTSFSNTCYLCSSVTILHHISQPHRMIEIIVLGMWAHATRIWRI